MPVWLEVSMTVDGELAEAVADILARFAPNGVMTEQGVDFLDDEDEGTPIGPITVRAYLEMDERLEETRHKLEEALFYLGSIRPLPPLHYRQVADQNWMEAWKERYHPIPIGRRLMIVPVWLDSSDPLRIPIKIDPGMAFGTGTHPTTQLCLELIEEWFERPEIVKRKSKTVIDVGCGSGILSIAALKLGAQAALGVDIDIESVRNARENAAHNGIETEFIIGQGSVEDVLGGKFPLRQAPLVVSNILAPVLVRLLEAGLADLTEPGGSVILSGILLGQESSVIEAAQAHGLERNAQKQMGDWVALSFVR